jgi:hypothetical protein
LGGLQSLANNGADLVRRILAGFGLALGLMMMAVPAWAGDAEVGMVDGSSGEWHVREPNGNDRNFFYGNPGDIPLIGDWNCDGVETPGMFRPGTGFVYLTNGNPADNGVGVGEIFYYFGVPGDIPIAGDWDGDGCDSLGIYRNGKVFLRDKLRTGRPAVRRRLGRRRNRHGRHLSERHRPDLLHE